MSPARVTGQWSGWGTLLGEPEKASASRQCPVQASEQGAPGSGSRCPALGREEEHIRRVWEDGGLGPRAGAAPGSSAGGQAHSAGRWRRGLGVRVLGGSIAGRLTHLLLKKPLRSSEAGMMGPCRGHGSPGGQGGESSPRAVDSHRELGA